MSGRLLLGACAAMAVLGTAPASAGSQPGNRLAPIREQFLAAVNRADRIAPAMAAVEALRATAPPDSPEEATLAAYRGALFTLRAKHGRWPPARMRHLREGLGVLDRVVRANPDHPEARYLRLMSCFYLPGVLGRGWSVREDFAALARVLPAARDEYDPAVYAAIVRFVLEHGRLEAAARRGLESALGVRAGG